MKTPWKIPQKMVLFVTSSCDKVKKNDQWVTTLGGSQKAHFSSMITSIYIYMAVGQNLVPLVNIKIAGKWMFIPLKIVLIGIDP